MSQILQNNLLPFDGSVGWLKCAVLSTAKTIVFEEYCVTAGAFPKDIVRSEDDIRTKAGIHLFKVFQEVKGTVRAGGHPEVPLNFVSTFVRHHKFRHQD